MDGRLAIELLDVLAMRPRQSAAEINERQLGLVNRIESFDLSKPNRLDTVGYRRGLVFGRW